MNKHQSDLDWLYNRNEPEDTRVFTPEEQAELNHSTQGYRHPGSQPGPQGASAQPGPQGASAQPGPTYPPYPHQSHAPLGAPYPQPPHGAPPQAPGPAITRRRKRRPWLKLFGFLLVCWLIFLVATPLYAWFSASTVPADPRGERPPLQPGTAVLLVGSDGRDTLNKAQREKLGTGSVEGKRADTMMLLYTPPKGRSVLLSLPRDSYVEIPGLGKDRLNAAFAYGGPKLLVETVEKNTGIRVDGYLEIGFLGVVDAVDAVGGIEVCPKKAIKDRDSHLNLKAGCQTLNGVTTLGYVRMRKADQRGDLGRVERQREVVGKVAKKALSPLTFINPVRYWQVNMAASRSLAHSKGFPPGALISSAKTFIGAASGKTISLTVPVGGTPMIRGMSVVTWNKEASAEMFHAIIKGDTATLAKYER